MLVTNTKERKAGEARGAEEKEEPTSSFLHVIRSRRLAVVRSLELVLVPATRYEHSFLSFFSVNFYFQFFLRFIQLSAPIFCALASLLRISSFE